MVRDSREKKEKGLERERELKRRDRFNVRGFPTGGYSIIILLSH